MHKNEFAKSPPMGWNSYDYYDTAVTEADIRANAKYMAENLKEYGWEYVVVDIEWYAQAAGTQRDLYQYIPFEELEMDIYGRLLPCTKRFPSAKDGKGFKPLADYVHSLGLKFGIHIMRGIPRIAAYKHTQVLHSSAKANEIADPSSICFWNPDMYGVRPNLEGSQAYYDSIIALYAEWGVDFIKVDDVCRMDMPSAKQEMKMLHDAIIKSGRPMVYSLSPGPAKIEEAWFYEKYANMWRITDDFWDSWPLLLNMFDRCELWQNHVAQGCYPDCDMLPVGMIGKGFDHERMTRFTQDEQVTMMTLWCMFKSPLMIGGEMTLFDDWTKKLLTNSDVLNLLACETRAKQVERTQKYCLWIQEDKKNHILYAAFFNLSEEMITIDHGMLSLLDDTFIKSVVSIKELWRKQTYQSLEALDGQTLLPHSAFLIKIKQGE